MSDDAWLSESPVEMRHIGGTDGSMNLKMTVDGREVVRLARGLAERAKDGSTYISPGALNRVTDALESALDAMSALREALNPLVIKHDWDDPDDPIEDSYLTDVTVTYGDIRRATKLLAIGVIEKPVTP